MRDEACGPELRPHGRILQVCPHTTGMSTKSEDKLCDPALKLKTRGHTTYPPTFFIYLYSESQLAHQRLHFKERHKPERKARHKLTNRQNAHLQDMTLSLYYLGYDRVSHPYLHLSIHAHQMAEAATYLKSTSFHKMAALLDE